MKATVIFGPPGTGKTTELMKIMDDHLSSGTEPQRIAFISFTKASVEVAKFRAQKKFNLSVRELPWFRTIHSLAFGALGLSRDVVMASHEDFAKQTGFSLSDTNNEGGDIVFSERTTDDTILYAKSLVDATGMSVEQIASKWGIIFSLHRYESFCERLAAWKKENRKVSFSDMIDQFIQKNIPLDVDVAFIDEAQDLTPKQWEMARCALRKVKHVYIAGDDDQAIYRWAGAEWQSMLDVRGEHKVLSQSHRIPRAIHPLVKSIANQITKRKSKEWHPSSHEGELHRNVVRLDKLPFGNEESWKLLARNNFTLNDMAKDLRSMGLLFSYNGVPSITPAILRDYKNGTLPSWRAKYVERIKDVNAPIRIEVSTIHQAKGTEADNVVLCSDISRNTHRCLKSPLYSDDEHRVMYVGASRARKRLFLMKNNGEYSYRFAK